MGSPEHARVRVARGIQVPSEQAHSLPGMCTAVIEGTTRDGVIACVTAARLHGLWLPSDVSPAIHIATATPGRAGRGMSRTRRPEFVAHRFELREVDVVLRDGLPCTSLARTWRDLAPDLSLPDLVAAGDSALRLNATLEELTDALDAGSRQRNFLRARRALLLLDRRSESRPESHMRVAVAQEDLPAFDVNESIYRCEGGWLARPDLSVREARIALEVPRQ